VPSHFLLASWKVALKPGDVISCYW